MERRADGSGIDPAKVGRKNSPRPVTPRRRAIPTTSSGTPSRASSRAPLSSSAAGSAHLFIFAESVPQKFFMSPNLARKEYDLSATRTIVSTLAVRDRRSRRTVSATHRDRKSVGQGKSVYIRGVLGDLRFITKIIQTINITLK